MVTQDQKLYSITIFGYKKAGMTEKEYHDYISITHAGHLKALLAKNDIVSYTMQHNTTEVNMPLLEKIYAGHLPTGNVSDCDALIQIVFKDIQDYLRVREDPHFISVVNPDHLNLRILRKLGSPWVGSRCMLQMAKLCLNDALADLWRERCSAGLFDNTCIAEASIPKLAELNQR